MYNWIHLKLKFCFGTAVSPLQKGKSQWRQEGRTVLGHSGQSA